MGDTPTTKNNWAASLNGVVQIIFTIGLTAGKEAIKTYVPFLRLPIISTIFNLIVDHFGDMIDTELQLNMTFLVMDIQTAHERQAFEEAKEALRVAKASKDQDAINKAKEEFKKNLGRLIHWDGST